MKFLYWLAVAYKEQLKNHDNFANWHAIVIGFLFLKIQQILKMWWKVSNNKLDSFATGTESVFLIEIPPEVFITYSLVLNDWRKFLNISCFPVNFYQNHTSRIHLSLDTKFKKTVSSQSVIMPPRFLISSSKFPEHLPKFIFSEKY